MGYPDPLTGLVILPVQMYQSYCTTVGLGGGGVGFSKIIKFYVKSFCLIGKVLSGELSCMWTGLYKLHIFPLLQY